MQLNVLRASGEDGNEMMRLVRYTVDDPTGTNIGDDIGSLTGSDG